MKGKKLFLIMPLLLSLALIIGGCGNNTPTATTPASPSPPSDSSVPTPDASKAEVKAVSLVDQVKNTGHYKFFPEQVAKGPEGTKAAHYSDSCIGCHSETKIVKDTNAKLADFFPGGKYEKNTEGITCNVCHTFEGEEMVNLRNEGWDSCMICHTGEPTLGKEVHHPQAEMIKGVGVGEVPDTPSYKYGSMKDSFSCTDCHITNSQKHDFMVPGVTATHEGVNRTGTTIDYSAFKEVFNQDKCVTCHANPDGVVEKLKSNQTEILAQIEELKATYDEWTEKVKDLNKDDPKVKAFNEGTTYLTYVEADSSKGAHNYPLAKALLEKAKEKYSLLK